MSTSARSRFEHEFADGLTLRNRTLFADYDKFYQNIYPNSAVLRRPRPCRGRHARRVQQPQRPPEPVQPDRPGVGKPARRDRPDPAVRVRGRAAEVAQPSPDRDIFGFPATATPLTDPTVDVDVTFASSASDANNRTRANHRRGLRPGPDPAGRLARNRRRPALRQLQAEGRRPPRRQHRLQPHGHFVVAAARPDPQAPATISRSTRASAAPICRNRATSSAGSPRPPIELKPERFDNYELGAKWEPIEGLLATAAVYQLDRTNTQARDPLTSRSSSPAPSAAGASSLGWSAASATAGRSRPAMRGRRRRSPRPPRPLRRDATCRSSRATASRCGTATSFDARIGARPRRDRALEDPMPRSAMR